MGSTRNKEIQVQRPAQSLEHFKTKVASADDVQTGLLKPVLAGAGVIVLGLFAWGGISAIRTRAVERHEAALSALVREVEGSASEPLAGSELQSRMRAKLPALEALARSAPGSEKAVTEGMVASWKLALEGSGGPAASVASPWERIASAQQKLAVGKGADALALLAPLRKDATPQEAWSSLFWSTLMDGYRLTGDRAAALKDYADYKERYKLEGDPLRLENTLKGI